MSRAARVSVFGLMILLPATHGTPSFAQDREKVESKDGEVREVYRTPVYDHRPGHNGIVGHMVRYSDGSSRYESAGGGGVRPTVEPNRPVQRPRLSNQPSASTNTQAELNRVEQQLARLLAIGKRQQERVEESKQNLNRAHKDFNTVDLQYGVARARLDELEREASAVRSSYFFLTLQNPQKMPAPYRCPNNEPYGKCTHYAEKEAHRLIERQVHRENAKLEKEKRRLLDELDAAEREVSRQKVVAGQIQSSLREVKYRLSQSQSMYNSQMVTFRKGMPSFEKLKNELLGKKRKLQSRLQGHAAGRPRIRVFSESELLRSYEYDEQGNRIK